MYQVKHVHFRIDDDPYKIFTLADHPNILVKTIKDGDYWSNFSLIPHRDEYKNNINKILDFDAYLKIKHTRRYAEVKNLWTVNVNDILAIVK